MKISAGFVLMTAWFAVLNDWRILLIILLAAAIHEAGHWIVLRFLGAHITEFRMGVLGMVLKTDCHTLSYGREILALAAGAGGNLLCAAMLTAFFDGMETLIGANLLLAGFNLLPMRPLDGGQMLYLLVAWKQGLRAGETVVRCTGIAVAAIFLLGIGYVVWCTKGSLWLVPAMGGFLLTLGRECRKCFER